MLVLTDAAGIVFYPNFYKWMDQARDKIFTIEHTFIKEDSIIATGYEKRAWVQFTNSKPKAFSIPEAVRKAISMHLKSV